MKTGSKLVKCRNCGASLFWSIPTDKSHYGIPEVKLKFIDGKTEIRETDKLLHTFGRFCSKCGKKIF